MRQYARAHAAILLALASMLLIAAINASIVSAPVSLPGGGPSSPRTSISLPGPGEDQDGDSYADAIDTIVGDRILRLRFTALNLPNGYPLLLAGTQDDQGRTGLGAELEWKHIVDVDPLGRRAGSAEWIAKSVRTGSWVTSLPMQGEERAITTAHRLERASVVPEVTWPQDLILNVRDDRQVLEAEIELWDVDGQPFKRAGQWAVEVDVETKRVTGPGFDVGYGEAIHLTSGAHWVVVSIISEIELSQELQRKIANQWAPTIYFDGDERFFPVPGDALERFHGFYQNSPNLQTWDRRFTNGRDTYHLLLADFNGDRRIDHRDAAIMGDFLAVTEWGTPTIYAHVFSAQDGRVILQYWLFYLYNYVVGEDDHDLNDLVHKGDREFIQLEFSSLKAAQAGAPSEVIFGRHYDGTRISDPEALLSPGQLAVFVARGSHATYPVAGDDRRLRPALAGFYDVFDGQGASWEPGNYTIELLAGQTWHAGYLWGPSTRYGRDFGTSTRPLLQHDFRYPYTDPLFWAAGLPLLTADEASALYGRPS